MKNETKTGNKPVKKFRNGNVVVSIWENVNAKEDRTFNTVTFERNYKDGEDWKNTQSLGVGDIPKLISCLRKTYEYLRVKEE